MIELCFMGCAVCLTSQVSLNAEYSRNLGPTFGCRGRMFYTSCFRLPPQSSVTFVLCVSQFGVSVGQWLPNSATVGLILHRHLFNISTQLFIYRLFQSMSFPYLSKSRTKCHFNRLAMSRPIFQAGPTDRCTGGPSEFEWRNLLPPRRTRGGEDRRKKKWFTAKYREFLLLGTFAFCLSEQMSVLPKIKNNIQKCLVQEILCPALTFKSSMHLTLLLSNIHGFISHVM